MRHNKKLEATTMKRSYQVVVSMELATEVIDGESEVNSMVIEKGREMLSRLDF